MIWEGSNCAESGLFFLFVCFRPRQLQFAFLPLFYFLQIIVLNHIASMKKMLVRAAVGDDTVSLACAFYGSS